ncbi:MAG: hypothetical protein GKS05_04435 [Nitrospirales bacterium]|nr:hypothetical protein [Nitrospirales bacterium]
MESFLTTITEIIPTEVWIGLTVFSVLAFIGTLIAVPAILVRLPEDYFAEHHPRGWMADHHPVLRGIGLIVKNVIGCIFFFAGVVMLVLPGQGVLTMIIGLSLIDFPGKRKLEQKIVAKPMFCSTINALRHKFGKSPLILS